MQEDVKKKLDKISDIWNHYILEYKFCNSKIKFTPDVKSNYFGDILRYFLDTFELIYNTKERKTFSDKISSAITFLQAIYIQQDFVEELLHIFRCKIDKGYLKKDKNYSINREIRNELVGHPIRKESIDGTERLVSSTIFSNSTTENVIAYLRYHIDNNYRFEEISHSKEDILNRHNDFLLTYFEAIIVKLKRILNLFKKRIEEIEKAIEAAPFEKLIKIVTNSFEYIFQTDYLYKPDILLQAYRIKDSHQRYQNAVQTFLMELKESAIEEKKNIDFLINDTDRHTLSHISPDSIAFEVTYTTDRNPESHIDTSYSYEMGKLVSRDNFDKFRFFSSILKKRCKDNSIILSELQNMEDNFDNDLEYYCSYHLIDAILNNKNN